MSDALILQHLDNAIAEINSAKALVGDTGTVPPIEPPPTGEYRLETTGRNWRLIGEVPDWSTALVFPMMDLTGFAVRKIEIAMEIETGPKWEGLHCLIDLIENAGRWKGDHVCLVNRGANGALAVSHTLQGKETTPVRGAFPLAANTRFTFSAVLNNSIWQVRAGNLLLEMPTPPLESYQLKLQLGQDKTEGHESNAGSRILSCTGSVS